MRRMMVFFNNESGDKMEPTPEMKEAFAAMDVFTEGIGRRQASLWRARVCKSSESKRVVFDGKGRSVVDGPFAESRELVAGFSIWEVKDMDEALAWVMRSPAVPGHKGAIELRPFMEVADLADFVTPEELAGGGRTGDRGKLGVA